MSDNTKGNLIAAIVYVAVFGSLVYNLIAGKWNPWDLLRSSDLGGVNPLWTAIWHWFASTGLGVEWK
jgi:hypothetical protein